MSAHARPNRRPRAATLIALLAALTLLVAACAEEDDGTDTADTGDDTDQADDTDGGDGGGEQLDTVTIGMVEWAENIANTALWQEILEEEGYNVEVESLDVAPVFAGVADGDYDLFLDMWLPVTHAEYEEEFGDQFEDLGVWYEGDAALNMTVPSYVEDINSIEDLVGEGDRFDNTIQGIDAGSGLAQTTNDEVMPGYGLGDDGWEHVESSEAAMLTELESAITDEEDIVVTLWTPHWAYAAYDLKVLEDPEGHYGEQEELRAIARQDLREDDEQLVQWIENFSMTEDELAELSQLIEESDDNQEAARQWIEENRDTVDEWLGN